MVGLFPSGLKREQCYKQQLNLNILGDNAVQSRKDLNGLRKGRSIPQFLLTQALLAQSFQ